jgi:hypothetical protein
MKLKMKDFIQVKYTVSYVEGRKWIKVRWSQNRLIKYPKEIKFDKEIAWLHGYWTGDRTSKTRKTVFGICDKELSSLIEVRKTLEKISPAADIGVIIYTKSPDECKRQKISKMFNLSPNKITFKQDRKQKHDYFIVHCGYKYSLTKAFAFIEENLIDILLNVDKSVRFSWYAGFFDAEGPFTSRGLGWNSTNENLKMKLQKLLMKDGFHPKVDKSGIFLSEEDYKKFSKFILPLVKNEDYKNKAAKIIKKTYIPKTYIDIYLKKLLENFGNKEFSYKDVMKVFGWTRGHVNMLLKGLVINNYLIRNTNTTPYTYKIISRPT